MNRKSTCVMFFRIIRWGLSISAGLLMLLLVSLLSYRIFLERTTRIETPNGISRLEEVTLGNQKQWIFLRGSDQNNPVLIFLHGGPGEPILGISSSRKLDAKLIKHFTVVHWDQRGAGKSYKRNIPIHSMTLDRWVEDCNELIDYVRNKFNTQKVFLVGHSSGTVLGIKTAYMYPEKIHAYVGVSQIINDFEQQKISYNFIVKESEKSGEIKKINAVKAIGPPPYETPKKEFDKAGLVSQFGGLVHENSIMIMLVIWLNYLTSPEYSLSEAFTTMNGKGMNFTTNARWKEIVNINFTEEIQSLKVPIYFFAGKYDMITPTIQVETFYNSLDAEKGKKIIIFEKSAHFAIIEEKEKYQDLLINLVLKENQEK